MRRRLSRRVVHSLSVAVMILAVGWSAWSAEEAHDMRARGAWIREAPPMSQALAGYMSLQNRGSRGYRLVGVSSTDFGRVMLHETEIRGGVVRMIHRAGVSIAAGEEAVFAPGGLHLMLMQPRRVLRAGDRVSVDLVFAGGRRLSVDFEVRQQPPP